MHGDLEVMPESATLVAAAQRMCSRRIGSLVVGRGGQTDETGDPVGIVTETDFIRKGLAQGVSMEETTVGQIMTSPLLTIGADRPILDASHLMELNHVRHLCVTKDQRVIGLLSVRDLVKYFVGAETGPVRDLDSVYRPLSVLMHCEIEKADESENVLAVSQRMALKEIGSLLVTKGGDLVGIVTESDIVRNAVAPGLDCAATPIGSIATPQLIDIDINRTIHDASDMMAEKGLRHLAVSENRKIVGILSVRDLIRMISVRDRPRFLAEYKKSSS